MAKKTVIGPSLAEAIDRAMTERERQQRIKAVATKLTRGQRYSIATALCTGTAEQYCQRIDKLVKESSLDSLAAADCKEFARLIDKDFGKRDGFLPQKVQRYCKESYGMKYIELPDGTALVDPWQ